MQRIFKLLALIGALQMGAFAQLIIQSPPRELTERRVYSPTTRRSDMGNGTAVVIDAQGSCNYSTNGTKFQPLRPNSELPEHSIVRTGAGTTDLFLRRMGATIRLEANTEIALDRTSHKLKGDQHEFTTSIEVRKGSILTVVHAIIAGSTLNIKNAAGNTLTGATVGSRYLVSKDSVKPGGPEKLASEYKNESSRKLAALVKQQVELDEVQGLAETSDNSNPGLEP